MMNLKNYIIKRKIKSVILNSILLIGIAISILNYDAKSFSLGFSRVENLLSRMYPLDLSILSSLYEPILETLNIAVFSSILALFTALFILPLLTNILFNIKILPKILSAVFSIFRTIPFLIVAAILVSLFSTGNFSGFLSIYIISFLTATKLLKEYAEEVDIKHIEAMKSLGVSRFAIYKTALLSNIKPAIFSIYFLILESGIRGASVLGMVGAGGIGQRLWTELNHLRYDRVSLIIIILVLLIFIIDLISYYFRTMEDKNNLSKKEYFLRKKIEKILIPIVIISSLIYVINFLTITKERFLLGLGQLKVLFKELFNPDISYFSKMFFALLTSIEIAFVATLLASLTAIFTSYLASTNLFGKYKAIIFKVVINVLRTFPPIIIALIFFRGFGPGTISSFFALYIYTVGVVTKMYSEILEGINSNILLATKSIGLGNFISYIKIIFSGYLPEFVTISLYRFEMNIKNSTILGMVGAGGIGQLLVNNIEYRNWNRISTLLIGLCTAIIIVENISSIIREKIKR
ncbi:MULTISPECIES: PhnE/PtxC family ABC transporter permease [Gemella]|uniref:PhnE/PtxC family ABC transporter permease n=1 Tax=Gemella TaxID=1378 RepID=UPI001E5AA7E2|nr:MULTISPECIES: ABC transporter permease subunit [Gemella]